MIAQHLHVGQSQPHTSEAPVLQFLGTSSKKRKRRSLEKSEWIQLTDHKVKANTYTQYLIRVKVQNVVWCFWTRYSMLYGLYENLAKKLKIELPKFPSKRVLGNLDPKFIEKRKEELNEYIQMLFQNHQVRESELFKSFLQNSKAKAYKKADFNSLQKFKLDV